jgi:hypothetical protein
MKRRLNAVNETIKLNVTEMANDLQNTDFNNLRDALVDMGGTVMGQIGEDGDLHEAEGDDDNVYMIIDGLSEKDVKDTMIDVISQYEDDVTDIVPEAYFVNDEDTVEVSDDDIEIPENDEEDFDIEDEAPIEDEDEEVIPGEDFPDYDEIEDEDDIIEDEKDFPDYDDVDIDDAEEVEECDNVNDSLAADFDKWDAENSSFRPRRGKRLFEKKEDCCPKKKHHKMVNLSEAIKAFDPKKQSKVDKSVKSIEDIIKSVKGQSIGS